MPDFDSNSADRDHGASDESRRMHQLYNPYGAMDARVPNYRLIYDLPTSPEFLFSEEAASQGRSWGQNLSFWCGLGYLSGATLGAARGAAAGLRAAERGESGKIRTNRFLNASGQAGRRLGNAGGVLGLIFSGLESGIRAATGNDGWLSTLSAGLGTGAVYKAAAGPRSAAVGGVIGGLAAGVAIAGKQVAKRYVPI